jgi:hypothetical protein
MKDLISPGWIRVKGLLFLVVGLLASVLLVLERPSVKVTLLLAIAIWCFCRFYYFAFYVLERYVNPTFRYSGLGSLISHLVSNRRPGPPKG